MRQFLYGYAAAAVVRAVRKKYKKLYDRVGGGETKYGPIGVFGLVLDGKRIDKKWRAAKTREEREAVIGPYYRRWRPMHEWPAWLFTDDEYEAYVGQKKVKLRRIEYEDPAV